MEIPKFKSQLLVTFEQVTAPRRGVQNTLVKLQRSVRGTLHNFQAARNGLRTAAKSSRNSIVATGHSIRKFRPQLSNAFAQGAEHLRRAQGLLARIRMRAFEKLQKLEEALRPAENGLRKVARNSRDGILAINHGIRKSGSQLSSALEKEVARLQRAQSTLRGLLDRVIERRRRLRQEVRARENDLRELLTSSLDAIVVINDSRRFVAANPKALELFGVSEKNLGSFTTDVFLLYGPSLGFDGSSSLFIGRRERHGKCKIRRLDGSLRFAECVFIQNFVPFRHLCRLYDVTPQKLQAHVCRKVQAGTPQYVNAQLP